MAGVEARVLIVGAGITGLMTAIRCAQAGHRVTVADRGAIPNPASSSFDQHRAIRALDPGDAGATARVAVAHRRWLELEALLGPGLYRRVGAVTACPVHQVAAMVAVAERAGVPVAVIGPERLSHVALAPGRVGVLEPHGGVLQAERVLRAAAGWLAAHPAVTLLPRREVTGIDVDTGRVRLADGGTLDADRVLIATGPWSAELVDRPVRVYRQTMVYLRPPADVRAWWRRAPTVGGVGLDGRSWLVPPGRGTHLKISSAAACHEVTGVVGDSHAGADRETILAASILVNQYRYAVVGERQCHYAVDADTGGASVIRLGPKVWARPASGGDGFRTAPLVADRIAAEMADEPPIAVSERKDAP